MRTYSRKSRPDARSISSASTQCAEVGWYSKRDPGSQLHRHAAEACEPRVTVVPLQGNERRVREPGRVQHHLLDGDDVFAVRTELRDVLGDAVARRRSAPAPIRRHIAAATTGLVAEKIT